MKLKTVELNGKVYAEVQDDKPVFLEDDGKEVPFDFAHTRATIGRLNGEAKSFRERMEAAESRAKLFDGIDDPEAAHKALETIKNLDQGQLVTAGKVEEIKSQAKKAAEEQVASAAKTAAAKVKEFEKERDKYRDELHSEKIGAAFSRSKFISEKAAVPGDLVQAKFGNAFRYEEGRVIAYGPDGNRIMARANGVDPADFDEALETIVNAYPYRDQILKGTGNTGTGARPSVGPNGQRTVNRKEYDAMTPMQQREAALKGHLVE